MSNNTSSSLLIRILWQGALVIGLIAGAWVISHELPIKGKFLNNEQLTQGSPAQSTVTLYQLPQVGASGPSAMEAINSRLASAKKEVIIMARQLTSSSLLTNLQKCQADGVKVISILSPDTTADFAGSRLAAWMRENKVTGVYKDVLTSASHVIVIDGSCVIVSDLPFSQRAYETDQASLKQSSLGFVYIIDDAAFATQLSSNLRARAQAKNQLL